MDIIDSPQTVPPQGPIQPQVQPVSALANLDQPLDDNAVRQALVEAESKNMDPMSVTIEDMLKGQSTVPAPATQALAPEVPKTEVPEKFLKPNGEVDVEKLQTSTRQLEEAVKTKEAAVQKTVDDFVREYRDLEKQFKGMPNPDRLAASLPTNPPPMSLPQSAVPPLPQMSDQQLEEMINRDIQSNPGRTITQLIQLALEQRFQPFEEEKKIGSVRGNLEQLASKDPRVLHPEVFKAINAKLKTDPEYWKLKNPHRAAWLDVKEELRLGDYSQSNPAQPSRLPAPVLGGGTPPSTPSVSVTQPHDIIANMDKLDLRDKKQEAMGDEAVRALLARNNR
jgi:hypothetical protein